VKHIDLFSGIGGFSIAAHRVGWETVAFCETDEFCRSVIERRFDRVRWISLPGLESGRQTIGLERDTKLLGLDPNWIVIENTYHRWRAWVPELRRKLHERGYASVCFRVRASDVGAHHRRSRAFIVANTNSEQLWKLSWWWRRESREVAKELAESWYSAPIGLGTDDGIPDELDRRKVLGNAVVPQCAELIFRGIEAVR